MGRAYLFVHLSGLIARNNDVMDICADVTVYKYEIICRIEFACENVVEAYLSFE